MTKISIADVWHGSKYALANMQIVQTYKLNLSY